MKPSIARLSAVASSRSLGHGAVSYLDHKKSPDACSRLSGKDVRMFSPEIGHEFVGMSVTANRAQEPRPLVLQDEIARLLHGRPPRHSALSSDFATSFSSVRGSEIGSD